MEKCNVYLLGQNQIEEILKGINTKQDLEETITKLNTTILQQQQEPLKQAVG